MVPESTSKETVPRHISKATAHDVYKALLHMFLSKNDITESQSEEIDRLLKEYAYKGSELRYGRTQDLSWCW